MKIVNVVGARPNFMKMAPIIEALSRFPEKFEQRLVHTGQHYDPEMSRVFFDDLCMPKPDIDLGVGSGSHAEQTAKVMLEFEKVLLRERPDLVIVVGDVNSTLACAITAKKLGVQVAHVEAGLRSHDRSMPEEINRLCTDALSDYLFTTDLGANSNLLAEGVAADRIEFVGNVMIDTLLRFRRSAESLDVASRYQLEHQRYATLTLHRPSNVGAPKILEEILTALAELSAELPIVFPVHPRTMAAITSAGLETHLSMPGSSSGIIVTEPMGYLEFLNLNIHARIILTDSGGLQEEATVLGVPCLTLRNNTERPITCEQGTNVLVGNERGKILSAARYIMSSGGKTGQVPDKWDGHAAERIVDWLAERSL